MSIRISLEQAAQYAHLEQLARQISQAIEAFDLAVLEADVPDRVKLRCINVTYDLQTQGLAYRLHPQTEWTGGDSSDPKNFVLTQPHIAKEYL